MNKYIFIIIASIFFISCQEKPSQVEEEFKTHNLKPLNTVVERKAFLQKVFDTDQQVRIESSEVELIHGRDSKESRMMVENMHLIDETNLAKIIWYLENYEYPDESTFGDSLSMVPALVVHHSSNEEIRRKFYPQFKIAFDQGRLDAHFFALYLGRMYEFEKGSYYRMKSPYMIEDQIDSLIVQLDLL